MSGKDGTHAQRRASPARGRVPRTAIDLPPSHDVAADGKTATTRTPGRKASAASPRRKLRAAVPASGALASDTLAGSHEDAAASVRAAGGTHERTVTNVPASVLAARVNTNKRAVASGNDASFEALPEPQQQDAMDGRRAAVHEQPRAHPQHRAHKHTHAQGASRKRAVLLVLGGLLLALLGSLGVDTAYCLVNKLPWAVSRALPSVRNPPWREARFREAEHASNPQFLQWYHTTISDAATRRMFSFGFGKSLPEGRAGGWLRVKGLHDAEDSVHAWPELWLPATALRAQGGIDVDILLGDSDANATFVSQRALNDNQVQVWAHWPRTGDAVNLTLTRTYGTFSKGEDCVLSNIPFAYASTVQGFIRIGSETFEFDTSPRYRAYVESTWGCTVPRSNITGMDPSAYPVRERHGTPAIRACAYPVCLLQCTRVQIVLLVCSGNGCGSRCLWTRTATQTCLASLPAGVVLLTESWVPSFPVLALRTQKWAH